MNATKSYIYGGEPVVWPTEQEAADAAHRVVACLTEAGHPRSRAVTMFVEAEDAYTFCVDTDAPRALVDKAHRVAGVDLDAPRRLLRFAPRFWPGGVVVRAGSCCRRRIGVLGEEALDVFAAVADVPSDLERSGPAAAVPPRVHRAERDAVVVGDVLGTHQCFWHRRVPLLRCLPMSMITHYPCSCEDPRRVSKGPDVRWRVNVEQVDDDTQDVTVSVGQVEEVLWVPTGTFDAYLNTWLPPLLDDEAAG